MSCYRTMERHAYGPGVSARELLEEGATVEYTMHSFSPPLKRGEVLEIQKSVQRELVAAMRETEEV